MKNVFVNIFLFIIGSIGLFAQDKKGDVKPVPPLSYVEGRLQYNKDAKGNQIPDFSYAGYKGGNDPIPDLPIRTVVSAVAGDATGVLQAAIDYVGSLPADGNGMRGAILLLPGEYKIKGSLLIRQSGVVLRGSGVGEGGTQLIASGTDRRTLIRILGQADRQISNSINVSDAYAPVNTRELHLASVQGLRQGATILIRRPSTQQWIDSLRTEHFGGGITSLGWKAGEHDIYWDRTITSINGNKITLDAPLTTALDKIYGQSEVIPYTWQGRISDVGIENMSITSEYDINNPKDEAHAWMGVTVENAIDVWIRNINFKHFAGSAVMIQETAKRVTVENCKSLSPVSEIGGQRRYAFFTMGQQCLFQRLYSENAYHDFGLGFCTPGPNAFVQCYGELPYSFSGPVDSWASGVLFDNAYINGNALRYTNRKQDAQGAGWNAANSVFWQCSASMVECMAPPTAQNWAFGTWSEFSGDGYWAESNNYIKPRSLYYTQLEERLGSNYTDRAYMLPMETEASSSPKVEVAMNLTKQAITPQLTLSEWIDQLVSGNQIPTGYDKKLLFVYKAKKEIEKKDNSSKLHVYNGRLVVDDRILVGRKHDVPWWNGTVQPTYLAKTAKPHLTRFVPGRVGTGLTDDIDSVATWMKRNNILSLDHNYGLWYERRRDDHERIRRINGEVWPPFYEQPFARSGQGTAYDGLSRYDVTKYNTWYWMRLKQFADLADLNDLVLLHQNYFQHNIIEAGAHWADSPWRPANNINNTGFPEPVPYAGNKRIFFAEQFYDIDHPVRREMHRAYIHQCLNNFRGNKNVIQLISAEFTGPLHFVEFWLDVIAEWERETGERQLVALSTTKDVQDAILADPVRSKIVDIIDIRYWQYRADGTTYEPKGGQNLAPRQHARLEKPGKVSFESVYRAVSEYRKNNPDKAVMYFADAYPQQAWAAFMAGGSLACLPKIDNGLFLKAACEMSIVESGNVSGQYILGGKDGYIIYTDNASVSLDLTSVSGKFDIYTVATNTGKVSKTKKQIKGGSRVELDAGNQLVIWLLKK